MAIIGLAILFMVDLGEKVDVRIKADTNTVYEYDREPILCCMRAVPVCNSLCRGLVGAQKREWTERKDTEDTGMAQTVEAKSIEEHIAVCNGIYNAHTLNAHVSADLGSI